MTSCGVKMMCLNCTTCDYSPLHSFLKRKTCSARNLASDVNEERDDSSVQLFKVFGFDFVGDLEFPNHLDIIFNIARQKFARLERCIFKSDGAVVEKSGKFGVIREDVCTFLVHLRQFIKNCARYDDVGVQQSLFSAIMRHLSDFIVYIGQIRFVPSHILLNLRSKQGNLCQSVEYHFLHLHLDIRWHILTILFDLPSSFLEACPSDIFLPSRLFERSDKSLEPFEQYVQLLIWDLIGIGLHIFQKISLQEYNQVTPFPCTCVRELWSSLIFLLEYRKNEESRDAFWTIMHNAFRIILHDLSVETGALESSCTQLNDSSTIKLIPDFSDVNRLGICWWWLFHLAPLCSTQDLSNCSNLCQIESNYFEVKNFCKLMVSNESFRCGERHFRCYLNCCIYICKLWEVSIEILLLLWEYFCNRINEDFLDPGESSFFLSKTSGLNWQKFIKNLVNNEGPLPESCTSYHIFLRLLAVELKKNKHTDCQREWKQLKGSINSNLETYPRAFASVNEGVDCRPVYRMCMEEIHLEAGTFLSHALLNNYNFGNTCIKISSARQLNSCTAGSLSNMNSLIIHRVFAKFHPRKMLDLNVVGLQNCFSLFLTLASIADLDDVVAKVCDLLELMDPTLLEADKYCVIWRAMFAFMLLSEEYEHDIGRPAQKIADDFNSMSKHMVGNSSVLIQKHMASELLNIYLEGLQDVFEHSSNLNLSEYILIAASFSDLLAEAHPDDLQIALTAVQVILARHRIMLKSQLLPENSCGETCGGSVEKVHYEALAEALWAYVHPLLNERTIGVVPQQLVANVATGFTLMVLDKPTRPSCPIKEAFANMVYYFGFRIQTRAELCCQYLINLLQEPNAIERMESEMADCQSNIIRAWFRLGIEIPKLPEYHDLTRLIFQLPDMVKILNEVGYESYSFKIQENALGFFFNSLKLWDTKKVIPNTCELQRKIEIYLSDVIPLLNAALKHNLQSQIIQIYNATGHVVQTISSLIYVKGKLDCLLHKIVTAVLLPPTIYKKEKPIHPVVLSALKTDLPLFIEGIARLGYRRDPYINRTLKDVLVNYLPRFSLKSFQSPGISMHPIVVYALSAIRKSDMDIVLFIIEVVKEHYLEKSPVYNRLQLGLDFMSEVLMRCSLKDQAAVCPVLLPSLLKLLLLLDDSNMRSEVLNLVKVVVNPTVNTETETCRSTFQSQLQHLISQHICSYADKVFRLLGTLTDSYPDVLGSLVPFIAEQISDIEQKKGGGNDDSLRTKYRMFLSALEVIHRL